MLSDKLRARKFISRPRTLHNTTTTLLRPKMHQCIARCIMGDEHFPPRISLTDSTTRSDLCFPDRPQQFLTIGYDSVYIRYDNDLGHNYDCSDNVLHPSFVANAKADLPPKHKSMCEVECGVLTGRIELGHNWPMYPPPFYLVYRLWSKMLYKYLQYNSMLYTWAIFHWFDRRRLVGCSSKYI